MKQPVEKVYCYVDENGQDTLGKIFIVSVIITGKERDELLHVCEQTEKTSGKGKFKWGKAEHNKRMAYLSQILSDKRFHEKLRYSIYHHQTSYDLATINSIAKAVQYKRPTKPFTTLVYIDGLFKTKRHYYGSELRKLGIPTRKVQGVTRDENNALTRLADTIAGFIRDVLDDHDKDMEKVLDKALKQKTLVEV